MQGSRGLWLIRRSLSTSSAHLRRLMVETYRAGEAYHAPASPLNVIFWSKIE